MFHYCLRHGVEACDQIDKSGREKIILCRDCQKNECRGRSFMGPNPECVIVKCKQFVPDHNGDLIAMLNEYLRVGKSFCVAPPHSHA